MENEKPPGHQGPWRGDRRVTSVLSVFGTGGIDHKGTLLLRIKFQDISLYVSLRPDKFHFTKLEGYSEESPKAHVTSRYPTPISHATKLEKNSLTPSRVHFDQGIT